MRLARILPLLLLCSCLGTEYYDVASDEIITPEGAGWTFCRMES